MADKLFDGRRTAAAKQASARARAQEFDQQLGVIDEGEISKRMAKALGSEKGIQPIRYQSSRAPGSLWGIEHARAGDDYLLQLIPIRPLQVGVPDVIGSLIVAMDAIFPRTQRIYYAPPNDKYKITFYTIKLADLARSPGWERAITRTLTALHALRA